jgi:hypothetical protein
VPAEPNARAPLLACRKSNPDILVWSPPRTGRQRICRARSTARENGASFSNDRCMCAPLPGRIADMSSSLDFPGSIVAVDISTGDAVGDVKWQMSTFFLRRGNCSSYQSASTGDFIPIERDSTYGYYYRIPTNFKLDRTPAHVGRDSDSDSCPKVTPAPAANWS